MFFFLSFSVRFYSVDRFSISGRTAHVFFLSVTFTLLIETNTHRNGCLDDWAFAIDVGDLVHGESTLLDVMHSFSPKKGFLSNELPIPEVKTSVVRIFWFVSKQTFISLLAFFIISEKEAKKEKQSRKLICYLSKGQVCFVCLRARLDIINETGVSRVPFLFRCFFVSFRLPG